MRFELLLSLLLLTSACAGEVDLGEKYGLPWADLRINEEREAQIYHGGKRKLEVPARLHWQGRTIRGRVSLSGSSSLDSLKKSYEFNASGYSEGGDQYSYKLSAQTQDDSFIRTLLGYEVFSSLGLQTPRVEAIVFSINGRYQGLYLLIEPIEESFFRRRDLSPESIYRNNSIHADFGPHLIVDPEFGFKAKYGPYQREVFSQIARWVQQEPHEDGLRTLETLLGLDNAIRLFAGTVFLENCDGLANNLFLYKLKKDPVLYFAPWDWERSFDPHCPMKQLQKMNRLFSRILDYGSGRKRFDEELEQLVQVFPHDWVVNFIEEQSRKMKRAYQDDPYLGGVGMEIEIHKDHLIDQVERWMTRFDEGLE